MLIARYGIEFGVFLAVAEFSANPRGVSGHLTIGFVSERHEAAGGQHCSRANVDISFSSSSKERIGEPAG